MHTILYSDGWADFTKSENNCSPSVKIYINDFFLEVCCFVQKERDLNMPSDYETSKW